jgi:hypothetical protein
VEEWGYSLLDDRLWEKAKNAENPHVRFYADLFARFGYRPRTVLDLGAIERIYIDEGTPELVDVLQKPAELNFSVNSALDESNNFPGLRERSLQERGNVCERCGAGGERRQLYLHRHLGCENVPELKRDPRSILVLCSVCLREFAWTIAVFGVSQPNRVVSLYTTIGSVAGERMLSLFKEKLGDLTSQERPRG